MGSDKGCSGSFPLLPRCRFPECNTALWMVSRTSSGWASSEELLQPRCPAVLCQLWINVTSHHFHLWFFIHSLVIADSLMRVKLWKQKVTWRVEGFFLVASFFLNKHISDFHKKTNKPQSKMAFEKNATFCLVLWIVKPVWLYGGENGSCTIRRNAARQEKRLRLPGRTSRILIN